MQKTLACSDPARWSPMDISLAADPDKEPRLQAEAAT